MLKNCPWIHSVKGLNLQKNMTMKTINISISELEYDRFGINKERLSFSEFLDIINREISKQTLDKCNKLSEKYGLSRMTMDEITDEVKSVRNAKSHH
jgi:hypothetical protein